MLWALADQDEDLGVGQAVGGTSPVGVVAPDRDVVPGEGGEARQCAQCVEYRSRMAIFTVALRSPQAREPAAHDVAGHGQRGIVMAEHEVCWRRDEPVELEGETRRVLRRTEPPCSMAPRRAGGRDRCAGPEVGRCAPERPGPGAHLKGGDGEKHPPGSPRRRDRNRAHRPTSWASPGAAARAGSMTSASKIRSASCTVASWRSCLESKWA